MQLLITAEKGEGLTPDEQEPLFYPLDYALDTWLEHKAHGAYPDSGSYGDQCPLLMRDWRTLTMYHIRVGRNVFTELVLSDTSNAPSWLDLAKD